jgi:hypothetical protein
MVCNTLTVCNFYRCQVAARFPFGGFSWRTTFYYDNKGKVQFS